MKVDFKITTWERVTFPDELKEEIIGKIRSGEISSANDLVIHYEDNPDVDYVGHIDDVDEQMTVEENFGQSTIEVVNDDNSETIYHNGEE